MIDTDGNGCRIRSDLHNAVGSTAYRSVSVKSGDYIDTVREISENLFIHSASSCLFLNISNNSNCY